jgi:mono/diheme cytochrome c family protein
MIPLHRALGAALALALLFTIAPARADDAPAGDAANGKRLYLAVGCYECHGRDGQGGAFTGPAPVLAQTALPFDAFKSQLRDPSNDMPPYVETVLAEKDVADIYAFLHTLSGPQKDIAILAH